MNNFLNRDRRQNEKVDPVFCPTVGVVTRIESVFPKSVEAHQVFIPRVSNVEVGAGSRLYQDKIKKGSRPGATSI